MFRGLLLTSLFILIIAIYNKKDTHNQVVENTMSPTPTQQNSGAYLQENTYRFSASEQAQAREQLQALGKFEDKEVRDHLRNLKKHKFTDKQRSELTQSIENVRRKVKQGYNRSDTGVSVDELLDNPTSSETMTKLIKLHKQNQEQYQ
jgi:hypothetical protein